VILGRVPYITNAVAPSSVCPELVRVCDSNTLGDMEGEIIALIGRTNALIEENRKNQAVDEGAELLRFMLRGMIIHQGVLASGAINNNGSRIN
jgi:hypothetical protein